MIIDLYSIAQKIPELIINIMLTFVTKKNKKQAIIQIFSFYITCRPK